MTTETETPKPRVDWRTLSEQTGYRVLTFPNGDTMNASIIASVRMGEARAPDPLFGSDKGDARRAIIDATDHCGRIIMALHVIEEDADAVFAMAAAAHRQWGGHRPVEQWVKMPAIQPVAGGSYTIFGSGGETLVFPAESEGE